MTTKRLTYLEQVVQSGAAEAFARYALALEYRKAGRLEDAMGVFERLRAHEPEYLPMYLMAGQILLESGADERASTWLSQGLALARERGDAKAAGELEEALAGCS